MPELPEVETIARQLDRKLRGSTVKSVEMLQTGRETPRGELFVKALVGKKIECIGRRAKLLVWFFTDGTAMLAHLKMTGRFVFVNDGYKPGKHDRAIFVFKPVAVHSRSHSSDAVRRSTLDVGRIVLVWSDVRKFGFVKVVKPSELKKILSGYGPEPLASSVQELADRLKTPKTRMVKAALLNQEAIAGVGNIYADESLHRAKLRPTRRLGTLSAEDRLRLVKEIKNVLRESLKKGGTSDVDYVDARGKKGTFQDFLRVYGRKGEACRDCGTDIKRMTIGQRGTHYCPKCQK
jgi:formamidopyrimidine-DNA glycosylase